MLTIKGFVRIPSFINNVENQISAVGELSLVSQTFSKDRQDFQDPAKDASSLVIFSSKDNGSTVVMPSQVKDLCLDIMEEAFANFVTSKTFSEQLIDAFPQITNVETGADITHAGKALTHWFSFQYDNSGQQVYVKLWLTNSSFAAEYDEYDVKVVAPAGSVEEYHNTINEARAAKDAFTVTVRNSQEKIAQGEDKATSIDIVELTWVDPLNPSDTLKTEWSLICYGPQSAVYENKLDAIRNFLLDNSTHDLASWVTYFPDLNNIDILYIFPQWDKVSLSSSNTPNEGVNQYSPIANYDKGMANLRKILTTVSLDKLKKVTDTSFHVWKSIGFMAVGSDKNSTGYQRFDDIFPTYTVMNVNDPNLGRLPADVQAFIVLLERVLIQAEIDDGSLALPLDMVRKTYNGGVFIEVVYNAVTYRVCTKDSYLPLT